MTLDDSRAHDAPHAAAPTFKIAIDAPLKIDHGVSCVSVTENALARRASRDE
jgi:hypothetical protein